MDRFVIVCAPKVPDGVSFVRPLTEAGAFYEFLNRPELGSALLHPTVASAPSFPVWQAETGGEQRLLVPDQRLQNVFQSPSRNQGLLFLTEPTPSALRLTFEGARYHYAPTQADDFGLRPSLFFDARGGNLAHRLLRETRSEAQDLQLATIGVGNPSRPPDGWMNPLVLCLELDGDLGSEPPPGAAQNDPRVVFRRLLTEAKILAILPEFREQDDARLLAWQSACAALNSDFTAVERLLLGGGAMGSQAREREERLRIFLGLDALGGEFILDGHGLAPAEPVQLTYTWRPPRTAAGNRLWLGERLAQRWRSGHALTRPEWTIARQAEGVSGIGYRAGQLEQEVAPVLGRESVLTFPSRTFTPAPQRLSRLEIDHATGTIRGFLAATVRLGASPPDDRLVCYFSDLLERFAQNAITAHEHIHLRWFRRLGNDRLALDLGGFFEDLARAVVAPRSRVLIRLPNAEGPDAGPYLSLFEAVPFGARSFLWGLLLDRDLRPRVWSIPLRMGWWNGWHTTLFEAPATVRIKFEQTSFSLGTAILGRGALGGVEPTSPNKKPAIRFSVPY